MQLTLFSDYTLRALMYLGCRPGETVPAARIAEAFGVSPDHMTKAAKWLTQRGFVLGVRGKVGGLRLACDPGAVRVGDLLRETEANQDLVECFDRENNRCPIAPACRLKGALFAARSAFFATLNEYTLADLLDNHEQLLPLFRRG